MLYIFDEMNKLNDMDIDLLSDERREKAFRYQSKQSRKLSIGVYLLLRFALKENYDIDEAVDFEYSDKGKPSLKNHPDIYFSLSHSRNVVVCAVSDSEVGVDVQYIAPVSDKVAKRVLTDEEYDIFKKSSVKDEYFCEIWTIKESYLKKTGQGICTELRNLSADSVKAGTIHRGGDYICCVTGTDKRVRIVGREEIEGLGK